MSGDSARRLVRATTDLTGGSLVGAPGAPVAEAQPFGSVPGTQANVNATKDKAAAAAGAESDQQAQRAAADAAAALQDPAYLEEQRQLKRRASLTGTAGFGISPNLAARSLLGA